MLGREATSTLFGRGAIHRGLGMESGGSGLALAFRNLTFKMYDFYGPLTAATDEGVIFLVAHLNIHPLRARNMQARSVPFQMKVFART